MRSVVLALTVVILVSPGTVAAQSDCDRSLKDMLEGTLEIVNESANRDMQEENLQGPFRSSCTLAMRDDRIVGTVTI